VLGLALNTGKLHHSNYQAADLFARARRLIEETGAKAFANLLPSGELSAACDE
jgi:hypothetical protein